MHLLSLQQKAELCQLARKAYDRWPGREEFELANAELSMSRCFEAWRRVEQGKAMGGEQSLCNATQDDFLKVRAHFSSLLGCGETAMRDLLRNAEEPRIRARYKLQEALDQRGLDENYAGAICRNQFKCTLGEASEKQLWNIFFTVSKRRKPQFSARVGRYVKTKGTALSVTAGKSVNPF
jgi:hypothetical protein